MSDSLIYCQVKYCIDTIRFPTFLALTIAFGSLYHDDVSIKPSHVVPVLAAATLLSLVCTIKTAGCSIKGSRFKNIANIVIPQ